MGRVSSIIVSIALILVAAWSALIASAARSDFMFRGCPDIPKETWELTANCADGSFGQVLFGSLALVCLSAVGFIVVRAFLL